jgi:hypothetical protein
MHDLYTGRAGDEAGTMAEDPQDTDLATEAVDLGEVDLVGLWVRADEVIECSQVIHSDLMLLPISN